MLKKSAFLLLISAFVFSCNSVNNIPVNNTESTISAKNENTDFYPISMNSSWTYQLQQFQNGQPNTKFREMTMSIINNGEENGAKTAVIKKFYPNSNTQPYPTLAKVFPDRVELSRYIQESVFEAMKANARTKDYIIAMKFPVKVGDAWGGRDFQGGKETIGTVGYEKITVPAGTFDTFKINNKIMYDNGQEDNLYYWYAKNVGMVKLHEEVTLAIGGQPTKMSAEGVLTSYSVK